MHNKNISYIHANWPNLNAYRIPGTPRPLHTLAPWVIKEPEGTGSKAPLHLDTLDLMADIYTETLDWLEQAGKYQTKRRDPGLLLVDLDETLRLTQRRGGTWCQGVEDWAEGRAETVRRHLDGGVDGLPIHARCPICGTWDSVVVRCISESRAGYREPFLRCESGICSPSEAYCGSWVHGFPAWPMGEWEWFAGLLAIENRKR